MQNDFSALHQRVLVWYTQYGRHNLPWRQSNDAYAIWISEIMLQQTQVKTVLERFYFPFLETFPTLADLAAADLDDVLKKWEGLGYYTRARNLHKTALTCKDKLPLSVHELMALPGIGKSTAHAIAAFAYKTPVPILDANVKRILCRYFALKIPSEKLLWEYAERLFDFAHPFEYNQAMMDIGATLCQAKSPTCNTCPLQLTCKAAKSNPLHYPQPKAKKPVPIRKRTIVIYRHNGRYGLFQRQSRFLHGLWSFMEFDVTHAPTGKYLGEITQKYSHFHLHANVIFLEEAHENLEWFHYDEISTLALSGADSKIVSLIAQKLHNT